MRTNQKLLNRLTWIKNNPDKPVQLTCVGALDVQDHFEQLDKGRFR